MIELDRDLLRKAVERIVDSVDPVAVYLYGSHAYGSPHKNSDVDLLIIVDNGAKAGCYEDAVQAYRSLSGLKFPAEMKVVSQAEFDKRISWNTSIEREVSERGKMLYDAREQSGRVEEKDTSFKDLRDDAALMAPFSVQIRYPGYIEVSTKQAEAALRVRGAACCRETSICIASPGLRSSRPRRTTRPICTWPKFPSPDASKSGPCAVWGAEI